MRPTKPPPIPLKSLVWEYKTVPVDPKHVSDYESALNNLGEQGWELVTIMPTVTQKVWHLWDSQTSNHVLLVLKRKKLTR